MVWSSIFYELAEDLSKSCITCHPLQHRRLAELTTASCKTFNLRQTRLPSLDSGPRRPTGADRTPALINIISNTVDASIYVHWVSGSLPKTRGRRLAAKIPWWCAPDSRQKSTVMVGFARTLLCPGNQRWVLNCYPEYVSRRSKQVIWQR